MNRILQAIRTALASIRSVIQPVMTATGWTWRHVIQPTVSWTWDHVVVPTAEVADAVLSIPARIFTRPAPQQTQQQTAQAAAEAQQQAAQAHQAAERALTAQQLAALVQRACRRRCDGRDADGLAEALGPVLGGYVLGLTVVECERVAALDARVVVAFVAGERATLPGVRTPEQVAAGVTYREYAEGPRVSAAPEPPQSSVLRQRILDRQLADGLVREVPVTAKRKPDNS